MKLKDRLEESLKNPPLWQCVIMDLLGCISYFVPALGETIDTVWAPIAAVFFYLMFGGKTGKIGAAITFVEEALPFTDFVPMFTIGWIVRHKECRNSVSHSSSLDESNQLLDSKSEKEA